MTKYYKEHVAFGYYFVLWKGDDFGWMLYNPNAKRWFVPDYVADPFERNHETIQISKEEVFLEML